MRASLLLLVACLAGASDAPSDAAPTAGPDQPGMTQGRLRSGDLTRTWYQFTPAKHDSSHPCPLLVVLHGGMGSADGMSSLTEHGFERLAEREDAIILYPQAVDKNWHDDREGLDTRAVLDHIDDVAFIRALIRTASAADAIDPKRIDVTGFSNGAMMCYRLAREAPEIAAIAPVAGLLPDEAKDKPWPRPVAVLLMQGTSDPLMPAQGGRIGSERFPRGVVLSVEDTVRYLLTQDKLEDQPQDLSAENAPSDGATTWRGRQYGTAPASGLTVYEIASGGHTWPGGRQYLPVGVVGKTCRSLDACTVIWEFFKSHPHL